jgi:apolipoprotein N-acyltransferase
MPTGKQNIFETRGIGKIGSPVCYETLFGEYITEFVKSGANLITIIGVVA